MHYLAPDRDAQFLLFELFRVQDSWPQIPAFADFSEDLVQAVVAEGGRLAGEVVAPTNEVGDQEGCQWQDGEVTTPDVFKDVFAQLAGGGWLGLAGNPDFGGQGMPKTLACLVEEMFWAANTSLYLYGTLTVGASLCIDAHGSEAQKATYLPKLYSGEWTGAMALTEAHAGTDLGIMRTKAEPQADGTYLISGTKIFITGGEHDLTENIVHLVLAKLPDAPAGTRGISLFIVPKYLVNDDGSLGARNQFGSGSIEHKMGIRGSATSVINYDGAVGYLLGEPNQGLAAMFTMMNYERLSVGLQGLGAGELAYQQAAAYARDRLQGRAPGGPQNPAAAADSLLVHPDVRRMLLTQRAYTEGGRAFALFVGIQLDLAKYAPDDAQRQQAQTLSELLTPVAKAYLSDRGFEGAVMAQQVFGGHGYIQEWGAEQIVRDTRIAQIYEGTNGVQALDLIGRKVLRDGGATLRKFVDEMAQSEIAAGMQADVNDAFDRLIRTTASVVERSQADANLPGAVSTDYLELLGLTVYAWLWGRMAALAPADEFGEAKRATAQFFFDRILPKTVGLEHSIAADTAALMEFADASF
ncbi:MAG: acyl-CoA dehydrogenase C-terminal domain-containing protein [Pseudomonadota bacterium]